MTHKKTLIASVAALATLAAAPSALAMDPLYELLMGDVTQTTQSAAPAATADAAYLADVSGLKAVAAPAAVNLSWASVPGADSYTIYYGTTPVKTADDKYTEQVVVWSNQHSVKDLTPGTAYYFAVTAEDSTKAKKGSLNYSTEVSATPTAAAAPAAEPAPVQPAPAPVAEPAAPAVQPAAPAPVAEPVAPVAPAQQALPTTDPKLPDSGLPLTGVVVAAGAAAVAVRRFMAR